MEHYFIRYQYKDYPVTPPDHWDIITYAAFEDAYEEKDVDALTKSALINPISSAPLKSRVSVSDKIAIIIEDLTRNSPKKLVLSALLKELQDAGIPNRNISIVISLGTHRSLGRQELEKGYGRDNVNRYEFINHDCRDHNLVPVGKLKTGTEVKINAKVYEADFKIGIGSIFPHPMNGFGGGGKILFPGVADYDSIMEHHLKYSLGTGSILGNLEGNSFYDKVCELSKAAGLDFIINSVLDHKDRLHTIICGDPVEAHLAGIDIARNIITRSFNGLSDITLISSFPYTEGQQIMKPLAPASMVTRPGGFIILCADAITPLPDILVEACEAFREVHTPKLMSAVLDHFDRNLPLAQGTAPEINMALAQALIAQDQFKVILVSEDLKKEAVERIGFKHATSPEEAFKLIGESNLKPGIHIIPSGGVILPIIE